MRLATILTPDGPTAALYQDGKYVELPGQSVRGLLARESFDAETGATHSADAVKLLPPIPDPPKILCIGLNYRDHAAESGAAIPREPVSMRRTAELVLFRFWPPGPLAR